MAAVKALRHPEPDLARLEDIVSLRCNDYEQCLLSHLRGFASEETLREAAAAYRAALREYTEALHLQQ